MFKRKRQLKRVLSTLIATTMLASVIMPSVFVQRAEASVADHVVISQVYGGGGNSGATYKSDFVELYNPTNAAVDLTGWTVQYAGKTGSFTVTDTKYYVSLSGSIKSHGYYLIKAANGTGGTVDLPAPDASNDTIAMSGTEGKVALVNTNVAAVTATDANIVDFVGYGAPNTFEGSGATPALTNTTSATRLGIDGTTTTPGNGNGWDTNNNISDFIKGTVSPRNSASPVEPTAGPAKAAAPIGGSILFANNGTITGMAGAATVQSVVYAYTTDSPDGGVSAVATATAGADGSFVLSFDNSSNTNPVYLTSQTSGKGESSTTRVDVAVPTASVDTSKVTFYVDENGKGTVTGSTGAALASAPVYFYNSETISDVNRLSNVSNATYATSDSTGSFSFIINNAPDAVYMTQLKHTSNGRMYESLPVKEDKTTEIVISPISTLREVDINGSVTHLNQTFTIEGTATVANKIVGTEFVNFYVQDATAGINVFNKTVDLNPSFQAGDKLRISGKLIEYRGLAEFEVTSISKIEVGVIPLPVETTIAALTSSATAEPLDGKLVTLKGKVTASTTQNPSNPHSNVTLMDENNKSITVRVIGNTGINVSEKLQNDKSYFITGIVGQYDTTSPYTEGYQVFPRSITDITEFVPVTISHEALTFAYLNTDLPFTTKAAGATSVKLFYRATGGTTYTELPMTVIEGNNYSVVIAGANIPVSGLEYYIEASNTSNQFANSGTAAAPHSVTVSTDTAGPAFSNAMPAEGSKTENKRPDISLSMYDLSGVNLSSVQVTFDSATVTNQASITQTKIVLPLSEDLAMGKHTVKVVAQDSKTNESIYEWDFEVLEAFTGGNHYRGTTHNHTNISHDGAGAPEQALKEAKKYNYDWFAFSDHTHDIDPEKIGTDTVNHAGMPERTGGSEWQMTKDLANQYTQNGEFVTFPAFEMTSTTWGHSNVFGAENFIDRKQDGGKYQNLDQYYAWVLTYDDIVAQFNHPEMDANSFNNFMPYKKDVDQLFTMFEVGNGSGHYSYANAEKTYFRALDLGWHVAPTFGEDNHDATWGQTMKRTVIVAPDLSQESLLHAMHNRRVYMAEDPNFTLDVLANGYYMGSTVTNSNTLTFDIKGNDAVAESPSAADYNFLPASYVSDDRVAKVELISNGNKVIASMAPNTKNFTWNPEVTVTGGQQWFVVRVTQADGEQMYSSPIWSKEVETDVKITDLNVTGGVLVAGTAATLNAAVSNMGTQDLSNLSVSFYYDSVDAGHLIGAAPLTSLTSKSVSTVSMNWASPVAGDHKLLAVVNAPAGDNAADNQYEKRFTVKAPLGITILIEASHQNENTSTDSGTYKDNYKSFAKQLLFEGYTIRENTTGVTTEALSGVKALIISYPKTAYTTAEIEAIKSFMANGGSLFLLSKSNNSGNPAASNTLLQQLGSAIQVNDDGIYDDSAAGNFWATPLTSKWSVRLHPQPLSGQNVMNDRVNSIEYYSGSSLEGLNHQALADSNTVRVLVWANETSYQYNLKNGAHAYDTVSDTSGGSAIPAIASEQIGNGRLIVSGMNIFNDKQMDETYNDKGNNEFAENAIEWLTHREPVITDIALARELPELTNVVVEGTVTTAAGVFFDAFYVQDATGGIMAFKEVEDGSLQLGDKVRVHGHIKEFENNLELEFDNFKKDVNKVSSGTSLAPIQLTTGNALLDQNQGKLVQVTGQVVSKYDDNSYIINDGSGNILVFTDGYIVNQSGAVPALKVGDTLKAVGLTGKNSEGVRIRVRDTKELSKVEPGPGISTAPIMPSGPTTAPDIITDRGIILGKDAITEKQETTGSGKVINSVSVNVDKLKAAFATSATSNTEHAVVVTTQFEGTVKVNLPAEALLAAGHDALIIIETPLASYELPLHLLPLNQSGLAQVSDYSVQVTIEPVDEALKNSINQKARELGATLASDVVTEFRVAVVMNGTETEVNDFGTTYVTRVLYMPNAFDPAKSTAVIYDPNLGEFIPVPAVVTTVNGKPALEIKRPGNSMYTVLYYHKEFADLAGHWAKLDIEHMASKLIVKGMTDTSFEPNRQITRAEFAALLVRSLGLNVDVKGTSFQDVDAIAWYAGYVGTAAKFGLVNGVENNRFAPNQNISRAEMAVMISRALDIVQQEKSNAPTSDKALANFKDLSAIPAWASAQVASLVEKKIMNGVSDDSFAPSTSATRDEAAVILLRSLRELKFTD